jgi:SAM-dependent methyltransferase
MGSAQVQGMLWGAAAQDWAAFQEATSMPLWTDVLRAAGAGHGIRILDAGCGAGGASVLAAQLGCNVTGADASPALLTIARQRLPAARFEEADIEALPFADGAFDAVIAVNSVMYASDMGAAVGELARVTAPGGKVVIASWGPPEKCDVADVLKAVGKTLPDKPPGGGPFALSTPDALNNLLSQAGLKPHEHGETKCDFTYQNFEVCWRAFSSAGPVQGAIRAVGNEVVRSAIERAVRSFTTESGSVILQNVFAWASGIAGE